jgi:hypothetical protein
MDWVENFPAGIKFRRAVAEQTAPGNKFIKAF